MRDPYTSDEALAAILYDIARRIDTMRIFQVSPVRLQEGRTATISPVGEVQYVELEIGGTHVYLIPQQIRTAGRGIFTRWYVCHAKQTPNSPYGTIVAAFDQNTAGQEIQVIHRHEIGLSRAGEAPTPSIGIQCTGNLMTIYSFEQQDVIVTPAGYPPEVSLQVVQG